MLPHRRRLAALLAAVEKDAVPRRSSSDSASRRCKDDPRSTAASNVSARLDLAPSIFARARARATPAGSVKRSSVAASSASNGVSLGSLAKGEDVAVARLLDRNARNPDAAASSAFMGRMRPYWRLATHTTLARGPSPEAASAAGSLATARSATSAGHSNLSTCSTSPGRPGQSTLQRAGSAPMSATIVRSTLAISPLCPASNDATTRWASMTPM
mmetsp:Transcript_9710/g.37779  ORF Transcript_9710/g.37779 Transcript_9710/m.37779 type:complete len:215 (+) Transcript_9710:1785-2429(+)